jgi:small ligand-binding sensory domain FIST
VGTINHASLTPRIFVSDRLLEDEFDASRRLGHDVSEHINIGDTVTLFYDSIASIDPLKLHAATPILNGFMEGCGHKRPQIVGGGLLTDLNLSEGWVYDGQSKVHHGVVALAWPSQLHAETFVMHGCIPASAFLEITRIDGAEVYELDGEPALQVLEKRLGLLTTGPSGTLSLLATLGQKQGDPYAEFDENAYVNRLILTANPETGSVTLFEPDFSVGSKVQVMARDNKMMLDSVRRGVAAANEIIRHGDAVFAMYIDCAGRASARSGAVTEEAEVLVEGLDSSIPLVGLYSGVEIAPFEGSPRGLDWTGLLCVMRYDQCR